MAFKFPNECENALVEEISSAAKGVFDAVFDGEAFQNPMGNQLGGITDVLNSTSLKLDELIAQAGDGDLSDALANVRDMLGLGVDGGGVMEQLEEFKRHSDMMSGVDDTDEFLERLGMAGSFDGAMQRLGRGEGAFGDIFRSFETGGQLVGNIEGQIGQLTDLLDAGLDDLDAGDLLSLGSAIGIQGGEIVGQIDLDNAAFAGASMLVKKLGIADMITDNNCYIKDLMDKAIGTPKLAENLPDARPREYDSDEQDAIEQEEIVTAEQTDIHDPVIARIVGNNAVKNDNDLEEVAKRPIFVPLEIPKKEDITPDSLYTTVQVKLANNEAELLGSTYWEEVNAESLIDTPSGWRQWYTHRGAGVFNDMNDFYSLYWNDSIQEWTVAQIDRYSTVPDEVMKYFLNYGGAFDPRQDYELLFIEWVGGSFPDDGHAYPFYDAAIGFRMTPIERDRRSGGRQQSKMIIGGKLSSGRLGGVTPRWSG